MRRSRFLRSVGRVLFRLAIVVCIAVSLVFFSVIRVVPPPFSEDECPVQTRSGIPRVIHQTWFGSAELPARWAPYRDRCLAMNPDYNYTLWGDKEVNALIHDHYPWIRPLYDSYTNKVNSYDVARFLILHHTGGVYLDVDIDCYSPLSTLFNDTDGVDAAVLGVKPFGITTYFMAANRGDTFITFIIDGLEAARGWYGVPYMTVIMQTGPLYVYSRYTRYQCKERVTFIQQDDFIKHFYHGNMNSWMGLDGKMAVWASQNQRYLLPGFAFAVVVMLLGCMRLTLKRYTKSLANSRLTHRRS